VTKATTHTRLATYTNIENKWSLSEIKITGREKSIHYKLLMYKAVLKAIWSYGVQLWGCAQPFNTKIIQTVQSEILRMVFNAPWYISKETLHEDSGISFVEDEIKRLTNSYLHNLPGHPNEQVSHLHVPSMAGDGCTDYGQQMC
jgi:hypothetical protein